MIEEIELQDATGDGCSLRVSHGTVSNSKAERIGIVARDENGDAVTVLLDVESVTELNNYLGYWLNAEVAP